VDPHPLQGLVRWLVFPALSTAAGAAAGAAAATAWGGGFPWWELPLAGAMLGAATALGSAISPKGWLGLLVGPVLGALAVVQSELSSRRLQGRAGRGFVEMVEDLLRAGPALFLIAMATGPVCFLHAGRMRRTRPLRLDLLLYGGAGAATGLAFGAFRGIPVLPPLILCVLLNLGGAAALEIALRLSRRPALHAE
jgi:hypothetical protein